MENQQQQKLLSVIIPVYNEVSTLRELVKEVQAVEIEKEIILVDDFSTDGTRDLYEDLKNEVDKIILHEKKHGKRRCAANRI